jgi:SNW domain-containing protein 1
VDFSADNGVGQQQKSKDKAEEQGQLIGTGPPPYRHRKGWLPRTLKDYGDGGAFPEIHVAQYPADMGRKRTSGNTNTVALRVGESGDIHYDAILRQGSNDNKQIQHRLTDIKPMDVKDSDEFSRPDSKVVAETAKRTQDALNKIIMENNKAKNLKLGVTATAAVQKAEYFKYTPQQPEAGITNRIIRMVEAPVDPFEPPRFKHKKIPAGAKSPPAPVLHSPPRKISSEEQKEWFIPPCVSHWKNPKGYIVPLDKRLASDGRDLQGVGINDKFAHFAEALFIAERHAREEVEKRNQLNKKLAQKEKEMKEERLRQLALKAREQQ